MYKEEKIGNGINYIYSTSNETQNYIPRYILRKTIYDKSVVLEYKERVMGLYAPRSVNSIISSLNAFFEFIRRTDCKIKTLKIQRRIFADKEKELTKAEYDRLLTAARNKNNDRLYYLMQTICATGIRVSELCYITTNAVIQVDNN